MCHLSTWITKNFSKSDGAALREGCAAPTSMVGAAGASNADAWALLIAAGNPFSYAPFHIHLPLPCGNR